MLGDPVGKNAASPAISSKGINLRTSAGGAYRRASGMGRSASMQGLCAADHGEIRARPSAGRFGLDVRFNGMRRHSSLFGRSTRAVHRLHRHVAVGPETQDRSARRGDPYRNAPTPRTSRGERDVSSCGGSVSWASFHDPGMAPR
jgi:hypothetical protein